MEVVGSSHFAHEGASSMAARRKTASVFICFLRLRGTVTDIILNFLVRVYYLHDERMPYNVGFREVNELYSLYSGEDVHGFDQS